MAKARIRINRTYSFIDKDPVIDEVGTFIKDRGLQGEYYKIALMATLSPSTIANWFEGDTKRPQHCSLASVVTALGGRFGIMPDPKRNGFDVDAEVKKARRWLAAHKPRPKRKKPAKPRKRAAKKR